MEQSKTQKKPSITIGIPTRYASDSLLNTVRSIYASKNINNLRLIIVADYTPIPESLKKELADLGVEIYWNSTPGSQFKKLKQIIDKTESDIFIFTQDDITFRPDTINEIVKTFKNNIDVTMVGTRILPLSPETLFEKSMTSMVRIIDNIACRWKNGDNYLAASGRCLSFKTKAIKKFNIREQVVNGDMYLYLENKRIKGNFIRSANSIVYIRCPQKIKDQIGPSSRYQFSSTELKKYFNFNIKPEYLIPLNTILLAAFKELINHPRSTLLYILVFFYTRIFKQPYQTLNPLWQIDISTKK